LGRSARTEAKVRVRQPLGRALVLHPGIELDESVDAEIRAELNVKTLERIDTLSGLMSWVVTPNFRALGPRLGPRVNQVKAALAEADGSALQQQLATQGFIEIAGERLDPTDVEIRAEAHEAYALAEEAGWAVALDLEIDDHLRGEGQARELVRALNDLRKAEGLAISDRIRVTLDVPDELRAAVDAHRSWIAGGVLAVELVDGPGDHELLVDGLVARATITRVD
jgi:isoleucyl-tRNA synthetase